MMKAPLSSNFTLFESGPMVLFVRIDTAETRDRLSLVVSLLFSALEACMNGTVSARC